MSNLVNRFMKVYTGQRGYEDTMKHFKYHYWVLDIEALVNKNRITPIQGTQLKDLIFGQTNEQRALAFTLITLMKNEFNI